MNKETVQDAINELENLADDIAARVREMKMHLRGINRDVADRARRTWLADLEMAIGDNNEGRLSGRREEDINTTIDDLRGLIATLESGHSEPEENCEGCHGK